MIRLAVIKRITVATIFFVFASIAQAQENLFVFVFKNGLAQQDIGVRVGEVTTRTNEFGLANFALPAGQYEVSYSKNGILFALTDINLLEDQQSQVFLTLTSEGEDVELDLPLAAYRQDFEQSEIKQQLGPKGTLNLKLLDSKSNTPIAGARLFFKGYAVEAVTAEDGVATLELSEDKYDISVVHPKYIMKVLKAIAVKADATIAQEAKLVRADIVLDEFVVSAPSVEGSLASTLAELKGSDVMGDALSSEQFSKSGDSSASGALKRVTGITVVGGKFVYIRGLGERLRPCWLRH